MYFLRSSKWQSGASKTNILSVANICGPQSWIWLYDFHPDMWNFPSICFLLAHWVRTTGPMISFHQYDDSDLPNVSPLSGFTELQGCCFEWVLSIQICRKSSFNFVLIVRNGICSPNMFQFIISNVHDIFVRKLEIIV